MVCAFRDLAWVAWTWDWDVLVAMQGLPTTPGTGPGCLLDLALFLPIAITNKGMDEQSDMFCVREWVPQTVVLRAALHF